MARRGAQRGIPDDAGTTIFEMLAVLVPATLLAAGAISFFATQNRTQVQQDLAVAMEENLRAAMTIVGDKIRTAGCGAPASSLGSWIGWVGGFAEQPIVRTTGSAYGDQISVAACSPQPVATVSSFAAAGSTSISLTSNFPQLGLSALFNETNKSLLLIGDSEHAVVTAVSSNTLTVDTDPTALSNQGLTRAFLPGTPVSRIDVTTFGIAEDGSGLPGLELDRHRGGSPARTAEGIVDLRLVEVESGRHYRVAMTARSESKDPLSDKYLTRTLVSDVHLRN